MGLSLNIGIATFYLIIVHDLSCNCALVVNNFTYCEESCFFSLHLAAVLYIIAILSIFISLSAHVMPV